VISDYYGASKACVGIVGTLSATHKKFSDLGSAGRTYGAPGYEQLWSVWGTVAFRMGQFDINTTVTTGMVDVASIWPANQAIPLLIEGRAEAQVAWVQLSTSGSIYFSLVSVKHNGVTSVIAEENV